MIDTSMYSDDIIKYLTCYNTFKKKRDNRLFLMNETWWTFKTGKLFKP